MLPKYLKDSTFSSCFWSIIIVTGRRYYEPADLSNNLLIYYRLAGLLVHLCHSNSLKMEPGCWNT